MGSHGPTKVSIWESSIQGKTVLGESHRHLDCECQLRFSDIIWPDIVWGKGEIDVADKFDVCVPT